MVRTGTVVMSLGAQSIEEGPGYDGQDVLHADTDPAALAGQTVAVIGSGAGHAHALTCRSRASG